MEADAMTKQIATSSESGASASVNSEHGIESFERLLTGFQSQLAEFRNEDSVLIGNCPQNVTDEEINKFFCGFATIVKLKKIVYKTLTTNVFIAKFDSTESASRSKVLNTLALNGKKILLLQPDQKHVFNKKNVVELNGLQEHSEEVIYDHMSTFGNVSFVLKTSTVTYIVYEELSAVESSCRCDYLDQYPVTIRSVLDGPAGGAGGQGSSIETCILEHIDQNSSLLADEEEGQINNFIQLLDMENLDEYLEQDEKEKSSASDKPLLEVGNEEIIVTENETTKNEDEKEADVAAIEKQAFQKTPSQRKKTAGIVLVDNRTKRILNLSGSFLRLTDLPQLRVGVRRVPNKVKIRPKKGSLPSKHKEPKKHKSAVSSVFKAISMVSSDNVKIQDNLKTKKAEPNLEKQKKNKEASSKSDGKSEKVKSKKIHSKMQNPEPATEQKQKKTTESTINENISQTKAEACKKISSNKKNDSDHRAIANITDHKQDLMENLNESKITQDGKKDETSRPEMPKNTSEKTIAYKDEIETNIHKESDLLPSKKTVFVQLTKLTSKQIQELSQIRRKTVTSHIVVDGEVSNAVKEHDKTIVVKTRKPGPAKGAMKEKQATTETQVVKETTKKAEKRGLSDSEPDSSACLVAKNDTNPASTETFVETELVQKKKKPKHEKSAEKPETVQPEKEPSTQEASTSSSIDESKSTYTKEPKAQNGSEQNTDDIQQPKTEESNAGKPQTIDQPAVATESMSEISQSVLPDETTPPVLDGSNTVEIDQIESAAADLESDEERPLVMDISFDTTEENIGKQSQEEPIINRKVVLLDSKSATLLKGSTHDGHFLFLDVLPRVAVKLRHVTASDYKITRPKEHHKSSSGHIEKPTPKKVSFDSSAVKKKEDKPEKPRKTNLDRIDSKFLPAGSKLKSKIKSKTEINHKKHLPVPELPIELKTHLNTSFKIPKKNSSVKPQSIDRNASELNFLHKEQDGRDKQRKRFQKERRPRDGPGGGRDWNQNRPEPNKVRQEREPSPTPDFFDPSFDDHSPSPQRIPPTPPPAKEIPASASQQTSKWVENQRPAAKNRANKPSFQDIWNISEKKPDVWAKPPWGSSAGGPNTIDSGNTWDSEPVQPHRERNLNTGSNITVDTRKNRSPNARAPQSKNTIDSGESWSPGGGAPPTKTERPQQSRTINDGDTWSPGNQQKQQPQRNMRQDITRSGSQQQVQSGNTISGGDLWDIDVQPKSTRKLTSPKRNVQQNPLLSGDILDESNEPAQFDRRPSDEQHRISPLRKPPERKRRSRSPFNQRRNRSRSPGRRRRSTDRSPIRRNQSADQSPDRKRFLRNQQSQSPVPGQQNLDWRANRSLDQRNFDRDQSPYGRRQHRSPDRLHGNVLDMSALRGSPSRMPFRPGRSCSPDPGHTLSSTDVWDFGTSSRNKVLPKQSVAGNTLLAGGTWDDEIVPLRGLADRSPPRLRVSVQDHRRQYDLDRISPNDRRHSNSRDRLLPEQIYQSFDRPPLREGDNRSWSRDRSPNRRKRSRSRSPSGWNQSMGRSPDRRRRSVGDHSPSYQNMLDYWKAVEDREMGIDVSSDRPNMERFNELGHTQSPERWMSRATDRDLASRQMSDRIDRSIPWANQEHPRHQAIDDSQYSPSSAFDVISSDDDECDFTNPRRTANKMSQKSSLPSRESLETIPLIIPSHSQSPNKQLPFEATSAKVDHEASFDSVPTYKEGEAPSSQSHSVLENLKQRAEGLKKLEEMKLARQKLLAQIGTRKPNTAMDKSERLDDDRQTHLYQEPFASNRQFMATTANFAIADNALLRNVDSSSVPGPARLLPPPSLSICTPQPFNFALPLPPLPSVAPPPPPPDEPRPPEPDFFNTMIPPPSTSWIPPSSSSAPMALIDVSKPPPIVANPLLNTTSSPRYESDEGESFNNRTNLFKDNNIFQPQLTPSNVFDKFRRTQLNREPNFPTTPENNAMRRMPSEENDFNNMEMQGFNEMNNQQRNRDPRAQHQQQQQGFGGNREFMRQQQQQQPRRDPRQSHDGNVYGGGQFNRNNNSRNNNRGNNFNNNNPRNNFNNNNAGNNFNFNNRGNNPSNNNPGNNFNFNHPGNNFNNRAGNNNPGNNFNSHNTGNNFNDNSFGNDFNDDNPGLNFDNNNSIDNFNDNNPGNNFNDDNSGNNFDDNNSGNNFNNNNPGNYFNFNRGARGGGRGRFNNNQQQHRFNFQQQNRTQRFNNNRNNEHLQQQQQQQQPRFLMQQQEMFDESCFDMNELDCNDEGDANNWDDLM